MFIYVFLVLLLLLPLHKIKLVKPFSSFNDEYFSKDSCKAIKGFLAILIILHHLSQKISVGETFSKLALFGYLSVAVFFFISGFGLEKKFLTDKDYCKGFIKKRLPTVLIPYIVVTVIYWAMYAIEGQQIYSLADIFIAIKNGNPIVSNSWYVIAIIIFYLVFYILMKLCKKNKKAMIIGGICYSILWVILCKVLLYGSYWYMTSHLLVIGMIYAMYEEKILKHIKKHCLIYFIMTISIFLALFIPMTKWLITDETMNLIFTMITAVLFVAIILLINLKLKIGNKILYFLGDISYEIYLIHGAFVYLFMQYIGNDGVWPSLVIVATIPSAFILHKLFGIILTKYKNIVGVNKKLKS